MRPVKLYMKAFGSYARETEVDFESFNGGLYLIVGKTGAGKTTIFDAISFALFGEPSGSERSKAMLHSDYVPRSEDTVVRLDFIHQGKRYRVERSLHFSKNRGTSEYNKKIETNAVFLAEGEPPIQKETNVNERCMKLLGMNAGQFKSIVMLAQGEFREFMKADDKIKGEILGKLFDSSEYVRFKNLMVSVRDRLKSRNDECRAEIETVMNKMFVQPDGDTGPAESYLPGNPHLIENLQALIDREKNALDVCEEECRKNEATVEKLTRSEEAAKADNALFDELNQKRKHLEELLGRDETISAQHTVYAAAEKALHRVKQWDEGAGRAQENLRQTLEKLESLKTAYSAQKEAVASALSAVEGDAPVRTEIERLQAECKNLESTLPRYEDLSRRQKQLTERKTALDSTAEVLKKNESDKERHASALNALRSEIALLEGCDAEAERLKNERDVRKERYESLTDQKKGIIAAIKTLLRSEEEVVKAGNELRSLIEADARAEERFHLLYQRFLGGQAGIMAKEMEQELSQKGMTVCPVCNTAFRSGEPHCFAIPSEHVPSEEEVEKARQAARDAEKNRKDKEARIDKQKGLNEQSRNDIVSRMQTLDAGCTDWGVLSTPGYLGRIRDSLKRENDESSAAFVAAQQKAERRRTLLINEKKECAEQERLDNLFVRQSKTRQDLEIEVSNIITAIGEMKTQLIYPDETTVREKLSELGKTIADLNRKTEAHQTAYEKAKETADTTKGSMDTLEKSIPALEAERTASAQKLSDALAENGFASREDYRSALAPIGSQDGENWLMSVKQKLDSHANDKKNTNERIDELIRRTAGKSPADTDAIHVLLTEAKNAQAAAGDAATACRNRLEGHATVLKAVADASAALAETENAYRRIDRLADIAVGSNGDGGKLSFDRYVMGTLFREVLEYANIRLSIMTGGKFELIHTMEANRRNEAAGLGMEVRDAATGQQRPSGSVSGGEGFMVSLALALGLSDVVQNHAGGQKLDTLFIDEGFGSLDEGSLDGVISVLQQLTEGNRLVGIISHVDKLEESIPQKLRVLSGEHGSTIRLELS